MLLWGRAVPRLSLTSLGSIRAGVVGCTSQGGHHSGQSLTAQMVLPSLSSSQNTSPSHCCAPAGLHISLSLRQLLPGHPTILISPQLPLPLPPAAPRMATGQILPALSLALHKLSLAPPHQHCSCSQAQSFPNQDSSF